MQKDVRDKIINTHNGLNNMAITKKLAEKVTSVAVIIQEWKKYKKDHQSPSV